MQADAMMIQDPACMIMNLNLRESRLAATRLYICVCQNEHNPHTPSRLLRLTYMKNLHGRLVLTRTSRRGGGC